jgi:mono/diheme cytochrome c family protein
MRGTIAAAGALVAACGLGGCRGAEPEASPLPRPDPVLAELGRDLFRRHCASCHGENGRGDGPAAGALRTPPADLTRIAARRGGTFPEGEIARFIDGRFVVEAHGTREMPVWGERLGERVPEAGVSEEVVRGQVSVVLEYLRSLQTRD